MKTSGLAVSTVLALMGLMPATAVGAMSAEQRLRMLEEQLKAAQEQIQQLRREVEGQKQKAAEAPPPAPPAAAAPPTETAKVPSKPWAPPKWLERITLLADFRFRVEGFYNQPEQDGEPVGSRTRERIRARVGLMYAYSDELSGAVRVATGNPNDPISQNVTLSNEFDPKDINLNWAYLQVAPGETFGWRPGVLTVQVGKFPLPQFRIGEMVLDDDLAPEGLNQKVAVLGKPVGYLEQLNLYLLQWVFQEVSDSTDGWMIGGQIAPRLKLGDVEVEVGLGQLWWYNADLIAQQLDSNSSLENTNLLQTATVDGDSEILGYRSNFNQTQLTALATFPNVVLGQPLRLGLDWVYNWGAATDQDFGVQGSVRLGMPKKRGDWALSLLYQYLQQEAAISTFTWSDFGYGGTNVMGPVVAIDYQLFDPLTLTGRTYFVNYIDTPPGASNATLVRLQLDATLRW